MSIPSHPFSAPLCNSLVINPKTFALLPDGCEGGRGRLAGPGMRARGCWLPEKWRAVSYAQPLTWPSPRILQQARGINAGSGGTLPIYRPDQSSRSNLQPNPLKMSAFLPHPPPSLGSLPASILLASQWGWKRLRRQSRAQRSPGSTGRARETIPCSS